MEYKKILQKVVDYIRSGEKPRSNFTLGFEAEHFVIDKNTLETVSYYGKDGVGETLKRLEKEGFKAYREKDHILNMERGNFDVSIEPGSQFEIAIKSNYSIKQLEDQYISLFDDLIPIFAEKNQALVTLGYHPNMKIEDIKILPKQRYDFMFRYLEHRGTMSHNMMKGTCALQVTIDFENEEDWKKKYFVANCLSPIFYALFDNSYIFEKEPQEKHNTRQMIWENTDPERSGIYDFVFDKDLSYERYAERIIQTPLIFIDRDGKQTYCGEKTLVDVMTDQDSDALIFHALSIVFPDVRVKRYIELRMMDEVKYPLNFACIALIKGLFYDEDNLNTLYEMFKDTTLETCRDAKEQAKLLGLQGLYKERTLLELSKELVTMAEQKLDKEAHYLAPLKKNIEEGVSPRDRFKKIYDEKGLREAVQSEMITAEDFK